MYPHIFSAFYVILQKDVIVTDTVLFNNSLVSNNEAAGYSDLSIHSSLSPYNVRRTRCGSVMRGQQSQNILTYGTIRSCETLDLGI